MSSELEAFVGFQRRRGSISHLQLPIFQRFLSPERRAEAILEGKLEFPDVAEFAQGRIHQVGQRAALEVHINQVRELEVVSTIEDGVGLV